MENKPTETKPTESSPAPAEEKTPETKPSTRVQKRGPGRPPSKKPNSILVKYDGIVKTPMHATNVLEVMFENAALIKKILTLLTKYHAQEITFNFLADKVQIYSDDLHSKTNIFADICCSRLMKYYCKEPRVITVTRESLDSIFKKSGKLQMAIYFYMAEEDAKSKLYIDFRENEHSIDFTFNVDILPTTQTMKVEPSVAEYPIAFNISNSKLKDICKIVASSSQTLKFSKDTAENPLVIAYDRDKNNVSMDAVFSNSSQINLVCNLKPDDIFSASVLISDISPIINSSLSDMLIINIDKFLPFSIVAYIGRKTYTKTDGSTADDYLCRIHTYSKLFVPGTMTGKK
jgi:hypothetical protein